MFPSTFTSFTNPQTTQYLNAPSHSSIESAQNDELVQVEKVIGVDGANSVLGTIIGDLRSSDSKGGGHVQGAAFGGTGHTTFTKGDILVARNASVLTKVAVGGDTQVLVADSSQSTGVKWGVPNATKIANSASVIVHTTGSTNLISTTIAGSTLGTSNAVKATAYVAITNMVNARSVMAVAKYGGAVVSSVYFTTGPNFTASVTGQIRVALFANNNVAQQRAVMEMDMKSMGAPGTTVSVISFYDTNVSSVESSANQTFLLTLNSNAVTLQLDGSTVEKIV